MAKPRKPAPEPERHNRSRSAGELIGAAGGAAFKRFGFIQGAIVSRWPEIVGDRYARVSQPESIRFPAGSRKGGTLTLLVEGAHAPLMQHLGPMVIERVNRFFGYEAIVKLVTRQGRIAAPNGGDWTQTVTQTAEGGFLMGNPDAPVKLVEFGSMTCPHCADFDKAAMEAITNTYVKSGRVSFEFRNFVRDPLDLTASVVARCGGPASFFGLTTQLFEAQKELFARMQSADQATLAAIDQLPPPQKLPRFAELAGLKEWAAMRGVPSAKLDQCLADQSQTDRLVQMQSDATSTYQISGTPSFLLNGKVVEFEGSDPLWTQLEAKLRSALGS